jgi:membrane-associated protein
MGLESILQQILVFTGTFSPMLIGLLFLICSVGEFGASIPYLLETVWLLTGYHVGTGVFSPLNLVLLWLVAQVGRQTGATALYLLSRFGSMPLKGIYQKYFRANLSSWLSSNNNGRFKLLNRINYLSPFSIAFGWLFGLRIPLSITLGVKRQFRTLSLSVLLSSLVWDGIYISLGMFGASVVLKPIQMIIYSLIGITVLYVVTFSVRRLSRIRLPRYKRKTASE